MYTELEAARRLIQWAAWVHLPNGWLFTSTGGGWEYPVFLAAAAAAQSLLGDGAYALKLPRPRRIAAASA